MQVVYNRRVKFAFLNMPKAIGECKNLKRISCYGNKFTKQEKENIKTLFPKCEISFE